MIIHLLRRRQSIGAINLFTATILLSLCSKAQYFGFTTTESVIKKYTISSKTQSSNAYNNYAKALLKKGDKKNAILNYEKAFQLDSTNSKARDIAQKLRNE